MTVQERPWSLRGRLTRRVLALVVGGWLATVLLSVLVLNHEMKEMFDEELQALVETTVLYLDTAQGTIPRNLGVQTNDGERVLRILPADGPPTPAPWPALAADGFHDAPGWRILRHSAEGAVIEAAHATTWRREEMFEAAAAFLALTLPLVALLLWGLRRSVAEATAPVAAQAGSVAGRAPDDLSPVIATGLPQELLPLVQALDGYLARIGAMRQAERDFVANAAHELRTPLAAIRARLDLSADRDAAAAVTLIDSLTRRVDRLLQLARIEAGVGIGRGPADLVRVLHLLLDEMRPTAPRPIRFDDGDLSALTVAADADALAILLRNLLENALDHGTGEVQVRLRADGGLTIENPADDARLPDARFARGPGSRGQGLGLSIIGGLAAAMGVGLTRQTDGGRVRVRLAFAVVSARS